MSQRFVNHQIKKRIAAFALSPARSRPRPMLFHFWWMLWNLQGQLKGIQAKPESQGWGWGLCPGDTGYASTPPPPKCTLACTSQEPLEEEGKACPETG